MNQHVNHVRRPAHGTVATLGSLALGCLLAVSVEAQEWRLEPELRIGGEYDDNARLRSDPAQIQEIDGYILEGALGIGYNTQRSGLRLEPRVRSRVYDETPDVDSDDQFLLLDYNYQGLKSLFEFSGSFERESVRTAERADADPGIDDPDDIPTDPTGLTFTNERRERLRLSPEWSYDVTERTTVGASYTYLDVSYDDALTNFLTDYTDHRVQGLLGRKLTERTLGYVGARARRFENDTGTNEVDGIGAVLGVESELSQTTRLQAEIGYEETEQKVTGESDTNVVGNLNLVRTLETVTLLAQFRRDVAAGGAGRVTERDTLNFNVSKRFTERVSAGLGARSYRTEDLGGQAVTLQERDQLELRAQVGVALSQTVSLEGSYSYTELDKTDTEGSAESNQVMLWLVYRPTPFIY